MRIAFLGTASAVPSAGDGYTSFAAAAGTTVVLVDTGDNPVRALREAGVNPFEVDAAVVTHHHVDHLGSLPSLVSALDCMGRKKPLAIVTKGVPEEKARGLFRVLDIDLEKLTFPVAFSDAFEASGLKVSLLPGNHSVPCLMVSFRENASSLLYTSDFRQDSEETLKVAKGYTSLIHEATYPHSALPEQTGHSSALQAGQAAKASGVKQLFLCHFYHDTYTSEIQAEDEARLAFDGEVITPRLFFWYTVA